MKKMMFVFLKSFYLLVIRTYVNGEDFYGLISNIDGFQERPLAYKALIYVYGSIKILSKLFILGK